MERRERREVDDELGDRRRGHRRECLRAKHAGTTVASATGLEPKIDLLAMLTTPLRVRDDADCSGWAGATSARRSDPDRSILSGVNHRLESRRREIRLPGSEGGGTDNRFSLAL
jgi:hypothetical protein